MLGDPVPLGAQPFVNTGKACWKCTESSEQPSARRFTVSRRENSGSEGPERRSDEEKSVPAQKRGGEMSGAVTQIRQNRCEIRKAVLRHAKLYSGAPTCVNDAQSRLTMRQSTFHPY